MKKILLLSVLALITACERPVIDVDGDTSDVRLNFTASNGDYTRGDLPADYFTKLNVMLFDSNGQRVWDKVQTQTAGEASFCSLSCQLSPGTYTVVAVGHSSKVSATIKSPQMVQFTAQDGEKLTDTFCYSGTLTVGETSASHTLAMHRACAQVRFILTDTNMPADFARMKIEYTGGSANFNPSTFEGTTKSSQSETRMVTADNIYPIFTFPYLADTGTLKINVAALDASGNIIRQRSFQDVSVTRNRITTYRGHFFEDGDGAFSQTLFGFSVETDWDGEDEFDF